MRQIIVRVLFAFIAALPIAANAQTLPKKIQEILSSALFVDGVVDREAHRVFWEELHKNYDNGNIERTIQWLKANTLLMQEYQYELWSAKQKKAVSETTKATKPRIYFVPNQAATGRDTINAPG